MLDWLRDAAATTILVLRQSAVSLRYNWGVGVLSIVLAISLWVFVTERENPERTGRVPGSVPVEPANVPEGQAICSISEESVTVRASAAESVLERLTAGDFIATIDLVDVTAQEAMVDVDVDSEEPRAEVVEVSPAQVRVRLESVTSRTVPVQVNPLGAPLRGFEQQEIAVEPEEAAVTGPLCLVGLVDHLAADVNLAGARTTFEQSVALQPRDELGGLIRGVAIEPRNATVRVEVSQSEFSGGFIVRPDIAGQPAEGFRVSGVEVEPAIVVVTGQADAIQTIDAVQGIETGAVSIDGATSDVVRTVALRLPEGTRAEQPVVTVRVTIEPIREQFSFPAIIQPANVPAGLTASLSPTTALVVLALTVPGDEPLDITEVVATVDLAGLGEGTHSVPVEVQAPQGVTVVSVTPTQIQVTLAPP